MKKVLVCRVGGFIGSHLVKILKDEGCLVRGVDIKFHEYVESSYDKFVKGDLWLIDVILRVLFSLGINKYKSINI